MNMPDRPTNTLATVSLVLGILSWIVLPFIGAVGAVICGHMARAEIRRAPHAYEGDSMAIAGLVLGYLHLLAFAFFMMVVFLFLGGLAFLAHLL